MKIGKNMKHALEFASKYSGWHTFKKDRATKNAILKLEKLKLVNINNDQFILA